MTTEEKFKYITKNNTIPLIQVVDECPNEYVQRLRRIYIKWFNSNGKESINNRILLINLLYKIVNNYSKNNPK